MTYTYTNTSTGYITLTTTGTTATTGTNYWGIPSGGTITVSGTTGTGTSSNLGTAWPWITQSYTPEYTCVALNIKYSPEHLRSYKAAACDLVLLQTVFIGNMRAWKNSIMQLWQDPNRYHQQSLGKAIDPDWIEIFRWAFSKVLPEMG